MVQVTKTEQKQYLSTKQMLNARTPGCGMLAHVGPVDRTRVVSGARCGVKRPDGKEGQNTQRNADGANMPTQTATW